MHNRDITFFRRIFFVSRCLKLSLENPTLCEKKFGFKKFYGWKRGYHVFPSESFGLTVPKNLMGTPSIFSENLEYQKTLCLIGGITFFPQRIFVSQCRKNSWASLQSLRKLGVSKTSMHTRGYHVSPSKIFGLTLPKTFVKESYCFWEKNWFEKVSWMKRGVSRFSVELFWSHSAEKFRGHPFNVSEYLGYRKFSCIIGISNFSVEVFLSHSVQNFR